jgi:hypothetical protein
VKLIEAAKAKRLIPLVCAGISAQTGVDFPNWRQLLEKLNELAVRSGNVTDLEEAEIRRLLDRGLYLMAAEELRYRLPVDAYETFLVEMLDPIDAVPAEVHRQLFRIDLLPTAAVSSVERRRLREDFGLQVITYDATPGHPEVLPFVSHLADIAES